MGNYIAAPLERVMEKQQATMIKSQDRMRRTQMAMQMAFSRDLFMWMGGTWTGLVSGITLAKLAGKSVPPAMMAPVTILGIVSAYQYDMGYGTKLNRVNAEMNKIIDEEGSDKHWFVPLWPPEDSKK
eukprot:TRINITY_DN76_c0_g2_i1.p1 TRINITY_DN76_c0_g2~~TRINITY_DN76_c0_g2_i1.p1  ORF type:complete len:127 (+),score=5.02 TRINITY_DN76_c0_g2_i1:159-539(+)